MMSKSGAFDGWIVVHKAEQDIDLMSLVNPSHIENIYPTKDGTIICLSSGKKLVDRRPVDGFLIEEGDREEIVKVRTAGKALWDAYENSRIKQEIEEVRRTAAKVKLEEHQKPVPVKVECEVQVDSYAGTCQGCLPLQPGYAVINRDALFITAKDGRLLGSGSKDGQVVDKERFAVHKSGDLGEVSGYVGTDGKYRLVFGNTRLGVVAIHFETFLETSSNSGDTIK
jgi:hypothetical protein